MLKSVERKFQMDLSKIGLVLLGVSFIARLNSNWTYLVVILIIILLIIVVCYSYVFRKKKKETHCMTSIKQENQYANGEENKNEGKKQHNK